MSDVVGGWRRWLVFGVVVICFCGGSGRVSGEVVRGEIVSVGIGGIGGKGGMYRPGAWVPVRVRLENRSGKQLVCRLGVEQVDLDGDKVLSEGPAVVLDAGDVDGRESWLYYWPRPDDDLQGVKTVVVLDESGSQVLATLSTPAALGGGGQAVGLAKRDDSNDRSQRWVILLGPSAAGFGGFLDSYGGTESVRFSWVQRAGDLPDNVLGFDGVDTIMWEADQLRASEFPPEFQLKAMLAWVRAGGHLIVSVSNQGQEFLKAGGGAGALHDAMPMTFTGLREFKADELKRISGGEELAGETGMITQALGEIRPGARAVGGASGGIFAEHPLAVTGVYGRGAVTVLTIDVTNGVMGQRISDHDWILFWNQMAGWQTGPGGVSKDGVMTRAEYESKRKADPSADPVSMPSTEIRLGEDVSQLVDVSEITQVRVLIAVLFLAVYWLVAGPVGWLILRWYKVVHWSWWVFGGAVLLAAGVAGMVVMFLQLTNYDLRHKTFVLGVANSREVTAVGFYGVLAPTSGNIEVSQVASGKGGGDDMNYLAPMCIPSSESVKPFADPQGYEVMDERPNAVSPVFRNTLKKMQGRWTGERGGIEGTATVGPDTQHPLTGMLMNRSGYDLREVQVIVHRPSALHKQGDSFLYTVGDWKEGTTIDLGKPGVLEVMHEPGGGLPMRLEDFLGLEAHEIADRSGLSLAPGSSGLTKEQREFMGGAPNDLSYLFSDARMPDGLNILGRVEEVRTVGRTTDCTKMLYAAGAMVVGRAGKISAGEYVASPVPLTVNGRHVAGKGEVLFAWALPLVGKVGEAKPADLNIGDPTIRSRREMLNGGETGSGDSLHPVQESR